jgi:hypothetical protein
VEAGKGKFSRVLGADGMDGERERVGREGEKEDGGEGGGDGGREKGEGRRGV